MSSSALVFVGLAAGVGIALAVSHAQAADDEPVPEPAKPPIPLPTGPEPADPDPLPPGDSGSGGGTPGAGSGDPHLSGLPDILQNINLSGNEVVSWNGPINFDNRMFTWWTVHHTLNDMDMEIYVSNSDPSEFIAMFRHPDPPGSDPPEHFIVYKVSDTTNKQWMLTTICDCV